MHKSGSETRVHKSARHEPQAREAGMSDSRQRAHVEDRGGEGADAGYDAPGAVAEGQRAHQAQEAEPSERVLHESAVALQ